MAPQEKETKKISVDHVNVRLSISFLVMKLIFADSFTTIALVALYYILSSFHLLELLDVNNPAFGIAGLIAVTIIESCLTVYVVLQWVSEYYEISAYNIAHKRGVFFKKVDKYGIQNVKQVKITQSVLGRVLNYGTVSIFDWRLSKMADLYAVHNPMRYLRILEGLLPNVDEHKDTFGSIEEVNDDELSA
ncbi:MAG: PH domain-containing protein [Candidatus Levybacteria bacterium]|nr:PH domain-containing protein [Candidatus Levybacteria bacterium]